MRFLTLLLLLALLGTAAAAQTPEGPALPRLTDEMYTPHGYARFGYYPVTGYFRFQGEYSVAGNIAKLGKSQTYLFAEVDVEAVSSQGGQRFEPNRLVGTFETGQRHLFGVRPLSFVLRHDSAHNIDISNTQRFQGNWDSAGVRWEGEAKTTRYTATLAYDYHIYQLSLNPKIDADFQTVTPIGTFAGRPIDFAADLHGLSSSGSRSGFVDFWLEPRITIRPQVQFFLGYGQIHDINLSANKPVDHPVITGIKFVY